MERPRLRGFDGKEQALPSWEAAQSEDWLGKWAMNQMLINVSTRKFQRSVRLPEGGVPAPKGSGLSKSAASRHFVALSAARLKEWMASRSFRPRFAGDPDRRRSHGRGHDPCGGAGRRREAATSIRSGWSRARRKTPRPCRP